MVTCSHVFSVFPCFMNALFTCTCFQIWLVHLCCLSTSFWGLSRSFQFTRKKLWERGWLSAFWLVRAINWKALYVHGLFLITSSLFFFDFYCFRDAKMKPTVERITAVLSTNAVLQNSLRDLQLDGKEQFKFGQIFQQGYVVGILTVWS